MLYIVMFLAVCYFVNYLISKNESQSSQADIFYMNEPDLPNNNPVEIERAS